MTVPDAPLDSGMDPDQIAGLVELITRAEELATGRGLDAEFFRVARSSLYGSRLSYRGLSVRTFADEDPVALVRRVIDFLERTPGTASEHVERLFRE